MPNDTTNEALTGKNGRTPCPSWCDQQYGCEWEPYDDHQKRWHSKQLDEVKDQLVTLEGPGKLNLSVELAAAERIEIDWGQLALGHQLGEPSIQLSIASRGPADGNGTLPDWNESLTHLTASQANQLIGLLAGAVQSLDIITGGDAAS